MESKHNRKEEKEKMKLISLLVIFLLVSTIVSAMTNDRVTKVTYTGNGDYRMREYNSGKAEMVSGTSADKTLYIEVFYSPVSQIKSVVDAGYGGDDSNRITLLITRAIMEKKIPISEEQYKEFEQVLRLKIDDQRKLEVLSYLVDDISLKEESD